MDILWAALAICAIVSVAFYVLALAWQRMLRDHSRAIRELFQRVESLEAMDDPFLRNKIGELMPSPLEQVFILSFRLGEPFWYVTMGATEQQLRHLREHGTFVGSVKIEIWRSHIAVTLRELLPQTKSGGWQTRTVDIYAADSAKPTSLWELCPAPSGKPVGAQMATVELRYQGGAISLVTRTSARMTQEQPSNSESTDEKVVFRIPLDVGELIPYRVSEGETENTLAGNEADTDTGILLFAHQDEQKGIDWQLRIRNLNGRMASTDWAIMEPSRIRRVS